MWHRKWHFHVSVYATRRHRSIYSSSPQYSDCSVRPRCIKAPKGSTDSHQNTLYSTFTFPPLLSTIMATRSNPRRTRQRDRLGVEGDDRVDPSTSQRGTPSKTRLANIPKQALEKASKSLRRIVCKDDDDDEIMNSLDIVQTIVQGALKGNPKQIEHLASNEEFRDNVTKKGEKYFIDSLRAMATNSETQGSKAWEDLFEDGTSFSSLSKHSDRILRLEVFLKKTRAQDVDPLHETTTSGHEGTQSFQSLSARL